MTAHRTPAPPHHTSRQGASLLSWLAWLALLILLLLALAWSAGAAEVRLAPADAAGKWGPALKATAERALARAETRLGLTLDRTVEIRSLPDQLAFESEVGERLTHIVAVARPEACQIVINRPAWYQAGPEHQEQILVHEMTHLLVGRRVPGRLPAWLDEGLAMTTAGEADFEKDWRVLVAGTLDSLIPVEQLMDRVALGEGRQDLAYAESLSLTRFYIRQQFPDQKGDDPAPLIKMLTDPETGARRVKLLQDPILIASLEHAWRHTYHTLWAWLMFLSGSSVLWLTISLLFLVVWWRKRRLARGIRERFEREEYWDAEFGGAGPTWEELQAAEEEPETWEDGDNGNPRR